MALAPEQRQVLERLPPISLEELEDRASLLRRTDRKYVIAADPFTELLTRLGSDHQILEIGGRREFTYRSTYFDTPDLRCFRDHVEDRAPRFKARTRLYRETDTCVFEVKLKRADGETDKRQIPYSVPAQDQLSADAERCLEEALADADLTPPEQQLVASLQTGFARITLTPARGKERTTCDFEVRLVRPDGPRAQLKDGLVVVETKSEHGDGPADRALARLGCEPVSLSKYRTGIALLSDQSDPDGPGSGRFFELLPVS